MQSSDSKYKIAHISSHTQLCYRVSPGRQTKARWQDSQKQMKLLIQPAICTPSRFRDRTSRQTNLLYPSAWQLINLALSPGGHDPILARDRQTGPVRELENLVVVMGQTAVRASSSRGSSLDLSPAGCRATTLVPPRCEKVRASGTLA